MSHHSVKLVLALFGSNFANFGGGSLVDARLIPIVVSPPQLQYAAGLKQQNQIIEPKVCKVRPGHMSDHVRLTIHF